MEHFRQSMLDLIIETSTNLPADVRRAMEGILEGEEPGSRAAMALSTIATNIDMACENEGAICQDTGMPTFKIKTPIGVNQLEMKRDILWAVEEATRRGKLRPNTVDSITGKNSGNNIGSGAPIFYWEQWERGDIEVKLVLKGGGCENKNIQYSLPATLEHLGKAGRDLEGVRKCILHAVWQAQGQGCSVGAIGVAVGSDRAGGYANAKEQLFRELDDRNPDPALAALEDEIMEHANKLNIGPMGFGGASTLIGCKIGSYHRLPASYFVSVAYDCWAFRRLGVRIDPASGVIDSWMYRDADPRRMAKSEGIPLTGKEIHLRAPISEEQIRSLKVGDIVLISGRMFTGRDALHKYLMDNDAPVDLSGGVLYHCGPVMLQDDSGEWHVKAAGPTTSIREEPYQADIIKKFGIRAVIGKGGMGPRTLEGLEEFGAVYLNAIGGAAQYYAETIKKVTGVHFLEEFGIPEALWQFETENFAAIVTMDAHGNSLHAEVLEDSAQRLQGLDLKVIQ
ncbi:MAG: FumA C-terminus/TtdB family hydratase beta subunit [Bacteroidota bacterium]|nr:FumA C-terminus/TtdB family hydratase beta subunit [Bacteroidota bacterium]